ncbi:YoaK family protein [Allohahella marinimesophila]|uniref:YoaK family protein n=1 Tax=Allohahella marinimesophila TaxID=1054972 RepID=A0ABP7PGR7_9GAMM
MINKLPRWVEYGAFTLALLAGVVNAVGLLGLEHQSISHLSGTATLLGTGFLSGASVFHLTGILVSFLIGSAISGYFLSSSSLKLGRHYDSMLVLEGALLFGAIYCLQEQSSIGHYLASAACGLQNALATRYSGAIVRTTHVTGVVTDLGLMFGAALRGEPFDRRKGILFLLIIGGFIGGGTIGYLLFSAFAVAALAFPAITCFLLAAAYRMYARDKVKTT